MEKPFITIFTPTYNRAYRLNALYQSLKRQTYSDFEWIVIDDGSLDNTIDLFEKWKLEANSFNIKYLKVDNGGKHRAINKGVTLAEGKLFFIVDSDDYLTDDALEKVVKWEATLSKDQTNFAGIAGAKGTSEKNIIGTSSNIAYIDSTSQERFTCGITGDKAEVFYTDILRKFPFPEIEGENFITESVVWFAIGKAGYKLRWFNDIIYIAEYLPDGLTSSENTIFKSNPKGYLISMLSDLDNLKLSRLKKMAYYAMYFEIGTSLGLSKEKIIKDLNISTFILFLSITLKKIKKALMRNK
ncbi:glycosyltransferase family 2 protein [Candidatus Clostridium radicumherbarum]|uniref:Glycosyltransferase family 2 protein n=1 Tax=Candidatus Clostridium radicumherbarum TaxID=3381662 RepID=A0ABW8TU92_9CLOT